MQKALKQAWLKNYQVVSKAMTDMDDVGAVATAFNTNIDAVYKISGLKLVQLVDGLKLSWKNLHDISQTKIFSAQDVLKGVFKCFEQGIAEEWITEQEDVYQWLMQYIGYDRLQMGGQAGIVANALASCGVQKVYAHTNSLPKLQAEQFVKQDNLLSFDDLGAEKPAYQINRSSDIPMVHWILEFDKGDVCQIEGHQVVCPKSNRFIVTYDPLNLNLEINQAFVQAIETQKLNFVVLSGFHALTSSSGGLSLLDKALPVLVQWRKYCPDCLIHLELASTQDIAIRKSILERIAPLCDSVGVNEREAMDVLEVSGEEELAQKCAQHPNSINLFEGILRIKEKLGCPRLQLHMFGLYITVQDKGFVLSPQQNRKGMILAAAVAAHKAKIGTIDGCRNQPLWSEGKEIGDVSVQELERLATYLNCPEMLVSGMASYQNFDVIAVPTIIVEQPVTLVGMGDTISSLSLVGSYEK